VVGAQCGVLFAGAAAIWFPEIASSSTALGVVGMAAFFTAVVRSPVTGIILVTEMTGSFTQLLPMLAACFTAMLIPTLLRDPPVYESLKGRTLRIDERERGKASNQPGR
jgi:CIC family chloride channel protein